MDFFEVLEDKVKKDGIAKRVSAGVIMNEKNEILLLKRRDDDFMGGIYELPSGNVDLGESIQEGLVREIKEETDLNVDEIGMYINTFDYLSGSGKKSRQFNFEVKVDSKKNIFLTEHDEYKWKSIEEVNKSVLVTDEVKYAINIFIYNKLNS